MLPASVVFLFNVRKGQRGWTAEETAELYRIEHALVQAGLSLQTDRGASDEGDPWFVFCRADGEVLVHVARIDAEYQLHSPALRLPLRGRVFSDLSKEFVRQLPLYAPIRHSGDSKLFLHPSAVLAIVIGTILTASEDNPGFSSDRLDHKDDLAQKSAHLRTSLQNAFTKLAASWIGSARVEGEHLESIYLTIVATIVAFVAGNLTTHDAFSDSSIAALLPDRTQQQLDHHAQQPDHVADSVATMDSAMTFELADVGTHDKSAAFTQSQKIDVSLATVDVAKPDWAPEAGARDPLSVADAHSNVLANPAFPTNHDSVITFETTGNHEVDRTGSSAEASGQQKAALLLPAAQSTAVSPATAAPQASSKVAVDGPINTSDSLPHQISLSNTLLVDVRNAVTNSPAPPSVQVTLHELVENAAASTHTSYNSTAEAQLISFWGANPHAQAVYDSQNIIIYDGTTPLGAAKVEVWDLGHGAVVAVVGHIDNPAHT